MRTPRTRFSCLGLLGMACTQLALAATSTPANYSYTDLKVSALAASTTDVTPHAINASGIVAGSIIKHSTVYDTSAKRWVSVTSNTPTLWSSKGSPTTLGLPKATPGNPATATAWAINTAGNAVGEANGSPAAWGTNGALTVLDERPGVAKAINDSGLVGGTVLQQDFQYGLIHTRDRRRATLWRNGVAEDLQQLLPSDVGIGTEGSEVAALNNSGSVGINQLEYMSSRAGTCWLLKSGVLTRLQDTSSAGCQVLAVLDDDSVIVRNISYPTPGTCGVTSSCNQPIPHDSVWQQGQHTYFPGFVEAVNPDGSVILNNVVGSTARRGRAVWRQGTVSPLTLTVSNGPSGTVWFDSVVAVNRSGQLVWSATLQPAPGSSTYKDRAGVLTPLR